jgi:hypothetical protein
VVFVDRQNKILRVVCNRRELKALVPAFVENAMHRGHLFRFEGRIYRPIDVRLEHPRVTVTLDELLPHQAIAYVLDIQRSGTDGRFTPPPGA